jgi:NADH-quinone oxidoreductase subunit C
MAAVLHSAPRFASSEGVRATLSDALGDVLLDAREEHGEILLKVRRGSIEDALRLLRDEFQYQQLMEIAGVDFPTRPERFEVVYMLLSVTRNHRIMVKVSTDEATPVPTVTRLWPNADWLEREVYDLYGVLFDGHPDLRRILTDYGFEGHPFRKDFPLTGYQEVRYSEEQKRVVYQPVDLPQDFRTFDFTSPWEGANYVLPGDEKAVPVPPAPNVQPIPATNGEGKTAEIEGKSRGTPPVVEVKTTDKPEQTGAGEATDAKAAEHVAPAARDGTSAGQGHGDPAQVETNIDAPGAPEPTEDRPGMPPRQAENPTEPKRAIGPEENEGESR